MQLCCGRSPPRPACLPSPLALSPARIHLPWPCPSPGVGPGEAGQGPFEVSRPCNTIPISNNLIRQRDAAVIRTPENNDPPLRWPASSHPPGVTTQAAVHPPLTSRPRGSCRWAPCGLRPRMLRVHCWATHDVMHSSLCGGLLPHSRMHTHKHTHEKYGTHSCVRMHTQAHRHPHMPSCTHAHTQEAVGRKEYWRLSDSEGRPPGVCPCLLDRSCSVHALCSWTSLQHSAAPLIILLSTCATRCATWATKHTNQVEHCNQDRCTNDAGVRPALPHKPPD